MFGKAGALSLPIGSHTSLNLFPGRLHAETWDGGRIMPLYWGAHNKAPEFQTEPEPAHIPDLPLPVVATPPQTEKPVPVRLEPVLTVAPQPVAVVVPLVEAPPAFIPSIYVAPIKIAIPPISKPFQSKPVSPAGFKSLPSWQTRANQATSLQSAFMLEVNRQMPLGCQVRPWCLIPASAWADDTGSFMAIACELFPASMENTMLLPINMASATALKLPLHPGKVAPHLEAEAHRKISTLRATFAAEHARVGQALERGNFAALDNREERRRKYTADLVNIAHALGVSAFGIEAWSTHRRIFSTTLKWPQL